MADQTIDSSDFYAEYHGHTIEHLELLTSFFRGRKGNEGIIFLAGDSSLDNKFWFKGTAAAVNGYEDILSPARSKKDVAYWMNEQAVKRGSAMATINCSVEESSVGTRACGRLLPQDAFVRDNIQASDVLVVSVGGNDIALKPNVCTIVNMLLLMCCTTTACIERTSCGCALPCDDCCCGFGAGCASFPLGCPPGLGYFIHLFSTRIQAYLNNMTSKQRPKKILVCMIYYPDELATGGWADGTLSILGYNSNPRKLQAMIRHVFRLASQKIVVPGTEVIAVPLFAALDGSISKDYECRVEPSAQGGNKMARLIFDGLEVGGKEKMQRAYEDAVATAAEKMDR